MSFEDDDEPTPSVTPEMAAKIKHLCSLGRKQHDIAARFGINQGRVSEIKTGKKFGGTPPDETPPASPQRQLPF